MSGLRYWDGEEPNSPEVYVEVIDYFNARGKRLVYGFNARGKRLVYGRGDHFGEADFNISIWRGHDQEMLVRFWSKDDDIEWRAFKIIGMLDTDIHRRIS